MQLLRQPELRALEQRYASSTPALMERAGHAVAALALRRFGVGHILACAGPGNNGGDAFVMARELAAAGCRVSILFRHDPLQLPADAQLAYAACCHPCIEFCREVPPANFSLVVDGLFGIGLKRPISGEMAELVQRINAFSGPVLALDVPSGLDADTGKAHEIAVKADLTATFIAGKPGLFTNDGRDHCGEVCLLDLDIPPQPASGKLLAPSDFRSSLSPRQHNSHKGTYGTLAVIGGAPGMAGAALLAGRAGLLLGAGRVLVGMLERITVDPAQLELMLRSPGDAIAQATAVVIGPGLGQSDTAVELIRRLTSADFPLLLDADALNLLASHPVLAKHIARRHSPTVLTPHPTEAARLLGIETADVQNNRIDAALSLAKHYQACIALKGCGTVLAHPDGRWRINTTGNPGLASGGTGDVLAGIAGALLAQNISAWEALCAAVHLHGSAADMLVNDGDGPAGLSAGELIAPARRIFNRWLSAIAGTNTLA